MPLRQAQPPHRSPALTLLGIVAVDYLFETYAVVLAAPLVIAIFIAVKQLYIRIRWTSRPSFRAMGNRRAERREPVGRLAGCAGGLVSMVETWRSPSPVPGWRWSRG